MLLYHGSNVEKAMHGGVIYPCRGSESHRIVRTDIGTLRGYAASVEAYGFPIPEDYSDYASFGQGMKSVEEHIRCGAVG